MSFDKFRKREIKKIMLKSFRKCIGMDKYGGQILKQNREYLVAYYGDEQKGEKFYKQLIDENEDVILENAIKYY